MGCWYRYCDSFRATSQRAIRCPRLYGTNASPAFHVDCIPFRHSLRSPQEQEASIPDTVPERHRAIIVSLRSEKRALQYLFESLRKVYTCVIAEEGWTQSHASKPAHSVEESIEKRLGSSLGTTYHTIGIPYESPGMGRLRRTIRKLRIISTNLVTNMLLAPVSLRRDGTCRELEMP